jgi:hypothetical protein
LSVGVDDRSRTRNHKINAGATDDTRTIAQADTGQFIADSAASDPYEVTAIQTNGITIAINPSSHIIAVNG